MRSGGAHHESPGGVASGGCRDDDRRVRRNGRTADDQSRSPARLTPGSYEGLKPYGWNDRVSALFAGHLDSGEYPARVVRVERIRAMVAGPTGEHFVATTG